MSSIVYQLVESMSSLARHGIETAASGNISARLENGEIAIKPSGIAYKDVSTENISVVSLEGVQLRGLVPSSDLAAHLAIYRRRPSIGSIIHSHAHFCTVWATAAKDIPVFSSIHADHFGGPIRCLPYRDHRKAGFGDQIVLEPSNAVLLARHGAVCIAATVAAAVERLMVLEEVARLAFDTVCLGRALGLKVRPLPKKAAAECKSWFDNHYGQ